MNCELCRFIVEFSDKVWRRIGNIRKNFSSKGNRIQYSEETITETLLLELKERFPDAIKVTSFTKPEEAENGADWFWMIKLPNGKNFRCLVQAKKIDKTGTNFGSFLTYTAKNQKTSQIDNLINKAPNFHANAVYALYVNSVIKPSKFQHFFAPWIITPGFHVHGCNIAKASTIKSRGSNKWHHIINYSLPLASIFCVFDDLKGSHEIWLNYLFDSKNGLLGNGQNEKYFEPDYYVPDEFEQLILGEVSDESLEKLVSRLGEKYPNLSGFVVVDLEEISNF